MKRKTWIVIAVLLLIGAIGSAAGLGKGKKAEVTVDAETSAEVSATVTPKETPKPTAAPTEAPLQTLAPAPAEAAAAPDRSAPAADPTPAPAPERDYVINTNTGKFHLPSCSSVKDIKASNRSDVHMTRDAVIAQGWQPCGKCKP